jgi:hypothetical protein
MAVPEVLIVPVKTCDGQRYRKVKIGDWVWFKDLAGQITELKVDGANILSDDQNHFLSLNELSEVLLVRGVRPGYAYMIDGVMKIVEETFYSSVEFAKKGRFIGEKEWLPASLLPMPLGGAPLVRPDKKMTARLRRLRNVTKRRIVWCPCPHVPDDRRIISIVVTVVDGCKTNVSRLLRPEEFQIIE